MTGDVKPRRAYRSTKRAARAERTRQDILRAAGVLFRDAGYSAVSMQAISTTADVAVETIYRAFGNKAGLFKAVIDAAVAGGSTRADVPVEERPAIRAVIDEPDPRRQIELYAATQPGIHRRSGPLLRALAGGAAADSELRQLWTDIEESRLHGQGRFVGMLAGRGALRPGLTVERGRDALWTMCSLAVYDMLVEVRGWTAEEYQAFLTAALQAALLPGVDA